MRLAKSRFLADRYLGTHRAIIIGSAFITTGHFCLAFPSHGTFFLGLGLIILPPDGVLAPDAVVRFTDDFWRKVQASRQQVADALFMSANTVEWNLTKIYRKLGVRSRTELAARLGRGEGSG